MLLGIDYIAHLSYTHAQIAFQLSTINLRREVEHQESLRTAR